MKTLQQNYSRNIDILNENLRRGMNQKQAIKIINSMEKQFVDAKKYNKNEKNFINEMRKVTIEYFTSINIYN